MTNEEREQRRQRLIEKTTAFLASKGKKFDEDTEAVIDDMLRQTDAMEAMKPMLKNALASLKGTRATPETYIYCAAFFAAKTLRRLLQALDDEDKAERMTEYVGTFTTVFIGQLLMESIADSTSPFRSDLPDGNQDAAMHAADTLYRNCNAETQAHSEYNKTLNTYIGGFQITMLGKLLNEATAGGIMTFMENPLEEDD